MGNLQRLSNFTTFLITSFMLYECNNLPVSEDAPLLTLTPLNLVITVISTEMITPSLSMYVTPIPTDDFPGRVSGLEQTESGFVVSEDQLCISIQQDFMWQPGDFWEGMETVPLAVITIDEMLIPIVLKYTSGPLTYEFGENQTIVGVHGGYFNYCIVVPDEEGFHTLNFTITSPSGETFSYSWEFSIQ